jgi:hypothetical protein
MKEYDEFYLQKKKSDQLTLKFLIVINILKKQLIEWSW